MIHLWCAWAWAHPSAGELLDALDPGTGTVPNDPPRCEAGGWLAAASGLAEEGRKDDALAAVDAAGRCGAEAPVVLRARALVLAATGPPSEAVDALDEAVRVEPGSVELLSARAAALRALGNAEAAAADLRVVIAGSGRLTPDAAVMLVDLDRELGLYEQALADADTAIVRIGPAPILVDRALELELGLGRPAAALGRLDGLPETPGWLDRRGTVLAWAGDPSGAVAAWTRAKIAAAARPTPANRALVRAVDDALAAW